MNTLFYGDNLEVLREHIADDSVDLVYLDPPFNSKRDYNILFKEADGLAPASQIKAFGDTWQYSEETVRTRDEIADISLRYGCPKLPLMIDGFVDVLGHNDVTAYLVMMAIRLLELKRVLKPTGSFYLHCDPTASHYLKIILDTIFGQQNFRNEITWKRTSSHNDATRKFGDLADIIFFYSKSGDYVFHPQYGEYDEKYLRDFYRHVDENGRTYRLSDLRSPNPRPNLTYDYKGYKPHPNGWAVSREKMEVLDAEGRLYFPKLQTGRIQLKRFLDEMAGMPIGNVWDDLPPISARAQERLGYPTQKPEALLERIIRASSNPGDVVLDPFCGCGTTVSVAQKLGRVWQGIDVTYLSIALIESRLKAQYDLKPKTDYRVVGVPADLASALDLSRRDAYQFQFWALTLIPAFPAGGVEKKGADRGIDGLISFVDGAARRSQQIIVQVKGGHVSVPHIRDLRGVIEREKAAMGFYVCLETPTKPMLIEAAGAGSYKSELWKGTYPRIQIRTVEELLNGQRFDYPSHVTAGGKQAARALDNSGQATLEM